MKRERGLAGACLRLKERGCSALHAVEACVNCESVCTARGGDVLRGVDAEAIEGHRRRRRRVAVEQHRVGAAAVRVVRQQRAAGAIAQAAAALCAARRLGRRLEAPVFCVHQLAWDCGSLRDDPAAFACGDLKTNFRVETQKMASANHELREQARLANLLRDYNR
jgi:hypothetical protein